VPYAPIGTRDRLARVQLPYGTEKVCGSLVVGDYLQADGRRDNELWFIAEDISSKHIRRRGGGSPLTAPRPTGKLRTSPSDLGRAGAPGQGETAPVSVREEGHGAP